VQAAPAAPPVMVTGPAAQVLVPDAPVGAGVITSATQAQAAQSVAAQLGILPPDAPKSGQSAPAATPIPPEQLATMSPAIQQAAAAVAPAPAPVAVAFENTVANAPPATAPVAPAAPPEKKSTRKPREPKATPPGGIGTSPSGPPLPGGIIIMVDAVVAGLDAKPLEPFVDDMLDEISIDNNRGIDVRCAAEDSPLAFGKWKGVLATFAKSNPPPAGVYTLHVEGSEARQVVAEALRPLCAVYIRGVRS